MRTLLALVNFPDAALCHRFQTLVSARGRKCVLFVAFIIAGCLFSAGNAKAQTAGDWKTVSDTLQIKISYTLLTCNGSQKLAVRVENSSSSAVSISWDDQFVSGVHSFTTVGKENVKSLTIAANSSVTASCETTAVAGKTLLHPLDLYFRGKDNYDTATLVYTISGFSKSTL